MFSNTILNSPTFIDPIDDNWAAFTEDHFQILDFASFDGINQIPTLTVTFRLPTHVSKLASKPLATVKSEKSSFKHRDYDSTEDFLSAQLFKRIAIQFPRPHKELVPQKLFDLDTFWQGIITYIELVPTVSHDMAKITIQSPFVLLQYQNNYRSFANKTTQEILDEILKPYKQALKHFEYILHIVEPPKRIQTVQKGESDFNFVMRLLVEDGLSFFAIQTKESCTTYITNNLSLAFKDARKKLEDAKQGANGDLVFYVSVDLAASYNFMKGAFEGEKMPIYNYRVNLAPSISSCTLFDTSVDYRLANNSQIKSEEIEQEKEASHLTRSNAFLIKTYLGASSTFLTDLTSDKRKELLSQIGKRHLDQSQTQGYVTSGSVNLFGFLSLARMFFVDPTSHFQAFSTGNYESNLAHYNRQFQAFTLTHRLKTRSSEGVRGQYAYCEVDLKLMPVDDKNFQLLNDYPLPPLTQFMGPYTATVVPFEGSDKTEKDFEVPNTIRVQLPWQKDKNESIKARWSTFWASEKFGSLYLPQPGDEVVIVFIQGEPDYPVIMGSLYNSKNNYPLAIAKREKESPFETRGVVFEKQKAQFTFGPAKRDEKTIQILNLSTKEGNLEKSAANINVVAKKSYSLEVQDPDSKLIIDDKTMNLTAFNAGSVVKLEKDSITEESKKIKISGKSEVSIDSSTVSIEGSSKITANSLTLPK